MGKKEKAYIALAVLALIAIAILIFRFSPLMFLLYLGVAITVFFSVRTFIFNWACRKHDWQGCKCSRKDCRAIKPIDDPSHRWIKCVCETCGIVAHKFENSPEAPGEKCSACGFIYEYPVGHKRVFEIEGARGDCEEWRQVIKDPKTGNLVWERISQ